jgi:signal transduction histidine kinase
MSPRVAVGFALAVATLFLVSAVTLNALSRRTLNGQSVTRSFEVNRTTQRLLAEIDTSQLALTDFVLTGDPELLEPYQSARRSIPESFQQLQTLTSHRPSAQRELEDLRPVLLQALELDAREAAERERGASIDEMRPMMLESRSLLKRSAAILDHLKDETHQLLDIEQKALADSIRTSTFVVVLGDVVLLALILAAAMVALRDAADKARAVQFQRRILGMVGHDLRNPLSVVMMSATQLAKIADGVDRRQGAVTRILGAAHRMEKMIRDLLDYSRIELQMALPLDIRPSDVNSCCQRVIEEFRAVHPGREIRYQPGPATQVSWDSDRIERVLENLVSNALKYSPKDSAVEVAWRREEERVIIEVKNHGTPIPDTLLPHLFEPFRRGSDHDAGTAKQSLGLGLYIVRHIVLQHGGAILVESSSDTGTTFRVALPQPVRASAAA